jgi:hypothetical protein
MSFEYPRVPDSLNKIILAFLGEMTMALDENVPLPRRAAIVVKWSWVISSMYGGVKPLETTALGDEEIRKAVFEMLRTVGNAIKGIRTR